MSELAKLITEKMLQDITWYSIQTDTGDYLPQTDKDGNPLKFNQEILAKHLAGEITCAIHPTHPLTKKCKFGGIDFDFGGEPNRENLKVGLARTIKVYAEAKKAGLYPYVEFSGRRGFHLYVFVDTPVLSSVMRSAMKVLLRRANERSDEIFPYSDYISKDYKPKAIKLVPAKHRLGGQSGFIDPFNFEFDGDLIKVPDQVALFEQIKLSPADILTELALTLSIQTSKAALEVDWNELSQPHPECVQVLTTKGVPHSMEYNRANMTLVRYGFSRNLTDDQLKLLGYQMAVRSNSHPTSKKDYQAKMDNLKSVLSSMGKHRSDPKNKWSCSFVMAEKDLKKSCLICPLKPVGSDPGLSLSINQADVLAEYELLGFILSNPEAINDALEQMVMSDCFMAIYEINGKQLPLASVVFSAMEECPDDLRPSTLLAYVEDSLVDACAAFLKDILDKPVCSADTFHKHCQRVRDNGIRMESIRLAQRGIDSFLDRNTPLDFSLDQFSSNIDRLHTKKASGGIKPMSKNIVSLVQELWDDKPRFIPTHSKWLNNTLNGGYSIRGLHVVLAPPGSGKTTFVNAVGDHAAGLGFPVIEEQFEMDESLLFTYSLSRIAGIDSRVIERRKFLEPGFPDKEKFFEEISTAIKWHAQNIAPRFFFKDADESITPSVVRGHIKNARIELGLPEDFPVLVIIDYLQLMMTGIQSLDESTNETLRVSRVASALTRVARSENAAILAISDITKESYKKAVETGRMDMSALRGSFAAAHAAKSIAVLMAGNVTVPGKKKEDPSVAKDQIELLADRYASSPRIQAAIMHLRSKFSLDPTYKSKYAVLAFIKNRGSVLGTPSFVYEKARHRYVPMEIDIVEELANDD